MKLYSSGNTRRSPQYLVAVAAIAACATWAAVAPSPVVGARFSNVIAPYARFNN